METTTLLLGAGGAAALLASFWGKLQALVRRATSHIVCTAKLDSHTATMLIQWLKLSAKVSRFGPRAYSAVWVFDGKQTVISPAKSYSAMQILFWYRRTPVWVTPLVTSPTIQMGTIAAHRYEISYIRGVLDLERVLVDLVREQNEKRAGLLSNRYRSTRVRGNTNSSGQLASWNGSAPQEPPDKDQEMAECFGGFGTKIVELKLDHLDNLCLSDEQVSLVSEVRFWFSSGEWYQERGIPWRRGYLFYGPPGTGKTALARAIAQDLRVPIITFDLASMDNYALTSEWGAALIQAPCIVIFEDIDAVFSGRENLSAKDNHRHVTFDCLLNVLDGIEHPNGVLTIFTTNSIESIDCALYGAGTSGIPARPGRIDRALEFHTLDRPGRVKMASRILVTDFDEVVVSGLGDSAAQFQERCTRLAVERRFQNG